MGDAVRYDADFFAWTQDQARVLREAAAARANLPLDWENLAEEMDSVGRSEWRGAQGALVRILEHLLKLEHSPARLPRRGWRRSVIVHRDQLDHILSGSPSLEGRLDVARAYATARDLAAEGLRRDRPTAASLPEFCPYPLELCRQRGWWPANRHGLED